MGHPETDFLTSLRDAIQRIQTLRRIIVCSPADKERLNEIMDLFPHAELTVSQYVDPGTVFVINPDELEKAVLKW